MLNTWRCPGGSLLRGTRCARGDKLAGHERDLSPWPHNSLDHLDKWHQASRSGSGPELARVATEPFGWSQSELRRP